MISKFKKHMLENQITIKYHIKVHPDFWPLQFGDDWSKWNATEQDTAMGDWLDNFSKFMKGPEGSGNSMMTPKAFFRGQNDKSFDLVEITEFKNHFSKDGTYIEDSLEASLHQTSALGLHGEIVGNSPSSQMGAGSGSGSRVAFNQRVSMSRFVQDLVLQPLYTIAEFNGWDDELVFRMRNSLITTLDTGASATKPNSDT